MCFCQLAILQYPEFGVPGWSAGVFHRYIECRFLSECRNAGFFQQRVEVTDQQLVAGDINPLRHDEIFPQSLLAIRFSQSFIVIIPRRQPTHVRGNFQTRPAPPIARLSSPIQGKKTRHERESPPAITSSLPRISFSPNNFSASGSVGENNW